MPRDLLTPILDDRQRSVNYFNGRVLYAEDLRQEQGARRRRHQQLGQIAGEGVARGLQVEPSGDDPVPRTVSVRPGTAVNRKGQVLHLAREVQLTLAGEVEPPPGEDALFADCGRETLVPDGLGPYVLLVAPASEYAERTPFVGIRDEGVSRDCGARYVVEGVQFRLVHLDVDDGLPVPAAIREPLRELILQEDLGEADESRLRNLLAHWCLGTASVSPGRSRDLFELVAGGHEEDQGGEVRYGPLDALRSPDGAAGHITDCDVPLALVYWGFDGIRFVDMWSVRRRLHRAAASSAPLRTALERRRAEAEAAFHQFQAQMAWLTRDELPRAQLDAVEVDRYFRYLPPAGLVPERVGSGRGLNHLKTFRRLTFREPVFMEGARLPTLLRASFGVPPVDLEDPQFLWLYRVRENRQVAPGDPGPVPYLVFTSGHLPYQGDAQYDLSRWGYSNYAPGVTIYTGE